MNTDGDIVSISRKGVFSLGEVRNILPIIRRFTKEVSTELDRLNRLFDTSKSDPLKTLEVDAKINDLLDQWGMKVTRLGGITKGLFLVDFDSGDGFYCWQYPEPDILYWHAYNEGFSGRISVETKIRVDHKY